MEDEDDDTFEAEYTMKEVQEIYATGVREGKEQMRKKVVSLLPLQELPIECLALVKFLNEGSW